MKTWDVSEARGDVKTARGFHEKAICSQGRRGGLTSAVVIWSYSATDIHRDLASIRTVRELFELCAC
jgi:hypothetical protein